MSWIVHSIPQDADLPEPDPPSRLELLEAERLQLIGQIRHRIRSRRQERIRSRINIITRQILALEGTT